MRSADYVDAIKARYKLKTYSQVAELLNVSKQSVTHYRNGHSYFEDEIAGRVAMLLSLDPLRVLADTHAERAKSEAARTLWKMIAARASAAAAMLMAVLAVSLSAVPTSAEARGVKQLRDVQNDREIYITRGSRRRRWKHIRRRWQRGSACRHNAVRAMIYPSAAVGRA